MTQRGTFHSAEELEQAIYKGLRKLECLARPLVWRASTDGIFHKVRHGRINEGE
jgi:hypothetical protein